MDSMRPWAGHWAGFIPTRAEMIGGVIIFLTMIHASLESTRYQRPIPTTMASVERGLPFIRNIPIKGAMYLQQLMLQHDG